MALMGQSEDVNIYSKTMNGDLEVTNRGGLPALLLPGELREGDVVFHTDMNEASVYVDTEEESTNEPVTPKDVIEDEDSVGYLSPKSMVNPRARCARVLSKSGASLSSNSVDTIVPCPSPPSFSRTTTGIRRCPFTSILPPTPM